MKHLITKLVFWAVILTAASISAVIPQLITYQGRITDGGGEVVTDGAYTLTFSIFDAAESGIAKWTETHPNVPVVNGIFSVALGASVPLTDEVFSGGAAYLETAVNGTPMTSRTQFTSVAYSQRIATVDGATGGDMFGGLVLYGPDTTAGGAKAASVSRIEMSFNSTGGSIALYDPVDSKGGAAAEPTKRMEMFKNGIVLFGETEADTNLLVAPNGDIVGIGQITMGENSSSGTETSVLGFQNTADGDSSTIGGGSFNVTTGAATVIAGGHGNTAAGEGSTISGGSSNATEGQFSVVSGGRENSAGGAFGNVPGGEMNAADGAYSMASGRRAKAAFDGSFVWADHTDEDFTSTAPDQFVVRAAGGVGINTDSPTGVLDVAGDPGDGSVNLPGDAIAKAEILDEPGVATDRDPGPVQLTQNRSTLMTVASVTITIPNDGVILLQGGGVLQGTGTSARNQAYLQIADIEGGGLVGPYWVAAGSGDHDSPNREHFFPMHLQRVFTAEAGTYTFYLEAVAHPDNGDGASTEIVNPNLTALYIPSVYGTMSEFVTPLSGGAR